MLCRDRNGKVQPRVKREFRSKMETDGDDDRDVHYCYAQGLTCLTGAP